MIKYGTLKQNSIYDNILHLYVVFILFFLRNRKLRVVLNGRASLADVNVWVPQGFTFRPLLFLIYTNNHADDPLNAKLFVDDTLLFSVVHNANTLEDEGNNDVVKINKWAYQWEISFNPDPIKQAQEVIFTRKIGKEDHPPRFLNNNSVPKAN